MNRNIDIIYFTLFRSDNPYSSVSISLGKEFAKNNRVFYINHPISYKDLVAGRNNPTIKALQSDLLKGKTIYHKVENAPENFVCVTPPLTTPINWLSNGTLYNKISARNDKKIKNTIRELIQKYNIKDYIFMNCFDPFFRNILPEENPPVLNIYQSIDDISQNDYTAKHGVRLEDEAVAEADLTMVTSRELRNLKSKISEHTYILHNAADVGIFKTAVSTKYDRPAEIKDVKTKIIGFTGNLDAVRVNYPLLKKIAEQHKDKTLLLVGPINNTECEELGIDKMPNVIFTGSKHISELPKYLQYCDCVIIPFLCNKLTKSIYPLKINEYLAAGRSVVSSNFSEDICTFGDNIMIAENDNEFVNHINEAVNRQSNEEINERQAIAATNTWTARVDQFWEIIDRYEKATKRSSNNQKASV